jgi:hypothetical protein
MKPAHSTADQVHRLPPLILHPFSDAASPNKLVLSSRASLMLQGILPNEEFSVEQLEHIISDGRFCEIRMLFYVGRDVLRWIDQCAEGLRRDPELRQANIEPQSFASLLIDDPPAHVRSKLTDWGVQDYRAIFARSIGLNAIFADAPDQSVLNPEFIRNYHYYADQMYTCWRSSRDYDRIRSEDFSFDLFASGEYSRMLERQWSSEEE